jgi:GNAT superfamily N-acetyltransferase
MQPIAHHFSFTALEPGRRRLGAMSDVISANGTVLSVRPVDITDVERLGRMFGRLSPDNIYFRFFSPLPHLPRSVLLRLAGVDHWHRDALVAVDGGEIVGLAGYDHARAADTPEISVAIVDDWQRKGIGLHLASGVMALARRRGHQALLARVLPGNRAALCLVRRLSPDAEVTFADGEYEARLPLHSVRRTLPREGGRPRMSA